MSSLPVPAGARRPLIYAHRGGAALRPENTLIAFDHGLQLGADGLELDVRLSRDGEVMVLHDETLDRTTSGHGPLSALTAHELDSVDAGYWFSPSSWPARGDDAPFRGQGIAVPRLREVLVRYATVPLIVELKGRDPELAHRAIAEIRAAGAAGRVVLGSFSGRVLRAAREHAPDIRTGASREEARWALYRSWVWWPLGRPSYSEFQVPEQSGRSRIVSPRFVRHARRAGLPVKVWTINSAEAMHRLVNWGVAAIITDRPDVAVAVLRREP